MSRHWTLQSDCLEIMQMPFYWRMSDHGQPVTGIDSCMPIRVVRDHEFDYLKYEPSTHEWGVIEAAYRQNANIGFINPESGQINTYGASVNRFFLSAVEIYKPERIYEIGCGAGFSIKFLGEHGWHVTGIDPSEYSLRWSERNNFRLINTFFDDGVLHGDADLIYCNDVFEHIPDVVGFSRKVCRALKPGGVFCVATTNSTESIAIGDISMLEHQHVNMFTERSVILILKKSGFDDVKINKGSYGNTFHITAIKHKANSDIVLPAPMTSGYFEKAAHVIESFASLYSANTILNAYVPLRCIPYLATVGDFSQSKLFDSNVMWRGKYIDGYAASIQSPDEIKPDQGIFFVGSMTFYSEIRQFLLSKGVSPECVSGIGDLI